MTTVTLTKRAFLRAGLGFSLFGVGLRAATADGGMEQFYKYNIKPETWLAEVFGTHVPEAKVASGSAGSAGLLQPLPGRVRYWRADGRTAWVFDEIGKTGYAPTTCGFVVKAGAIESAKVLIYRESRADQVGDPSFLRQLTGAKSTGAGIDKHVDNISGATFSVNMMVRMAKSALALDASVPA